jgi:hypothetical protein
MLTDQEHVVPEREDQEQSERRRQYEADLEPLVAEAAPQVREGERAWLGRVSDLAPSRTDWLQGIPDQDQPWAAALEAVVHRHGLSYELITDDSGGALWLVPPH